MAVIVDEPLGAERVGADDEAAGAIGAEAREGANNAIGRRLDGHQARCGRSRGGGRAAGEGERGRGSDEMAAGKRLNHPATISAQPLMSMVSDVNWALVELGRASCREGLFPSV